MILAAYVHHLDPFALRLGPDFGIRWYGLAYVLAFLTGYILYKHLAKRGYSQLKPEQVGDFITWAALFGVFLGGRLGYFVLYDPSTLFADPIAVLQVWKGGMASHGGIAALVLYTLWYARRHNVSWLNLGDNLVVVAPLGLFFGRLANFINGELYGRPTNSPFGVVFPQELERASGTTVSRILQQAAAINPSADSVPALVEVARSSPELSQLLRESLTPRHPSQLYEALTEGLLLFGFLWLMRTRWPFHAHNSLLERPPRGLLTASFFLLYAIARIACEVFREPDASLIGPFTRGQFYSLFMIGIGLVFLIVALRTNREPGKSNAAPG
jgi:phosphatidylglycerol:prolipoprotein diacylglycerol transferase